MRKQVASLATAQAAAADLAVILATVRAALGGTEGRAAGNLLEMAELDALSARDAIERAIWEMDLTPSADPGCEVPTGPVSAPRRAVASVPGRSRRWWCCHRGCGVHDDRSSWLDRANCSDALMCNANRSILT